MGCGWHIPDLYLEARRAQGPSPAQTRGKALKTGVQFG